MDILSNTRLLVLGGLTKEIFKETPAIIYVKKRATPPSPRYLGVPVSWPKVPSVGAVQFYHHGQGSSARVRRQIRGCLAVDGKFEPLRIHARWPPQSGSIRASWTLFQLTKIRIAAGDAAGKL
jgi:hypothetical protein